jgi:hypothetical protein
MGVRTDLIYVSLLNSTTKRNVFILAVIFCLYTLPAAMAAEPVLIGESSYESFVEGDYVVYTNYSDNPYNKTPKDFYLWNYKGKVLHNYRPPLSNIYLHNISSGETIPVYMSECKSTRPWILNGTIYWYEDRSYQVFYKQGDPNPPAFYIYSVPVENISFEAANNYSLLNPYVMPAGGQEYNESVLSRPNYSSDLIEIVREDGYYSIYYNDPKNGNRTQVVTGMVSEPHPPLLNGDRIFWEDYRTGIPRLFVYDIKTGREYQIAPQVLSSQYDCSVDGDIVSWNSDGEEVYYVNFSGLIEEVQPVETPEKSPEPTEAGTGTMILVFSIIGSIMIFVNVGRKKR